MTHNYTITGMTCSGCQAKVHGLLSGIPGIKKVQINLSKGEAAIEMDRHIATADLKAALKTYPRYQLSEQKHQMTVSTITEPETRSWLEVYTPILLVFAYIIGITLLIEMVNGGFSGRRWMNHFMAGFFLVFSFFKFLNLKAFAESYAMYDILAKRWNAWGYVYAGIELALGAAFLTGFNPLLTNAVTFVVMSVSIIGVLQSIVHKRKIKCACLGAVFNLPMSTITVIEDGLMIGMSLVMLTSII